MSRTLPETGQDAPPEVDPATLAAGDRVVVRATRFGGGRPIRIVGTARLDHERPEFVVEESNPNWTWLLAETGKLYVHEGGPWRRLVAHDWSLHRVPATDGGSRRRDPEDIVREGGNGLPPRGPTAVKGDGNVWLFTCCECGKRWANPPGPVTECSCGSEQVVCHRIDHARYSRIRWYSDPRAPDVPDPEELVSDGGALSPLLSVRLECPDCGATHCRALRIDPDDPPETIEKRCIPHDPERAAGLDGCGETLDLVVLDVEEVGSR